MTTIKIPIAVSAAPDFAGAVRLSNQGSAYRLDVALKSHDGSIEQISVDFAADNDAEVGQKLPQALDALRAEALRRGEPIRGLLAVDSRYQRML